MSWSRLILTLTENKVCRIWAVSYLKTQPGLEVSYKDKLLLTYLVLRRPCEGTEDLTRCLGKVQEKLNLGGTPGDFNGIKTGIEHLL